MVKENTSFFVRLICKAAHKMTDLFDLTKIINLLLIEFAAHNLRFKKITFLHNINFIGMAYVKQVCDGYTKKSFMGNWFEERLYPNQPFREEQKKNVRVP
jgi:hypothetical protein